MAGRQDVQRLSVLLDGCDTDRRFDTHIAYFYDTPSIRPVVQRNPTKIEIRISKRFANAPDDVLRDIMLHVLRRLDSENTVRFGRTTVNYLTSDGFIDSERKRGVTRVLGATAIKAKELKQSRDRVMALLPEPTFGLRTRRLDIRWRKATPSLRDDYIASTDPLVQAVFIDGRLRDEDMPKTLLDYVVFREILVLCAFDMSMGRVDMDVYRDLHTRFPDCGRMARLCDELSWEFTVPLRASE